MLREVAPSISQSLTHIFNLSLQSSTFPQDWKTAVVIPLFKQRGDASAATNYRPVSLLPAVAKVLDAIQSKRLSSFLVKNKLLTDHQFGFLPGRSTTQQLVYVVDAWLQTSDKGGSSVGVFLDFQKAFDKVWHKGLLFKLACCGVSPNAVSWFESYLLNRAIIVRVDGTYSESYPISTGVPQGSHLGPILFAVFIDDLTSAVKESQTELYADDALIHRSITKNIIPQGMESVQRSVSAASAWAQSWRGRFSPAKTVVLPLGNLAMSACQQFPLTIDDEDIKIVDIHKHLGLIFSTDLKWTAHLESTLAKARKRAGLLRHIHLSHHLPAKLTCQLYCTYVRPIMEYACPVWHSSASAADALALERVQASVARTILAADWDTPKDMLFRRLDWPSLRWRRTILCMTLFHQLVHHGEGLLAERMFQLSSSTGRSVRKPHQLLLGKPSTAKRLNGFYYSSAILWNRLPAKIQDMKSPGLFRTSLEEHWIRQKYDALLDPYS